MAPEDKFFLIVVGVVIMLWLLSRMSKPAPVQMPRPRTRTVVRNEPVGHVVTGKYQHWGGMNERQWMENFGYPSEIIRGDGCLKYVHRHPRTGAMSIFIFRNGLLCDWV